MKTQMMILAGLILLVSFSTFAQDKKLEKIDYVTVTKFDPQRSPDADLKDAIAEATRTNKRIILDVGGEWCSWCHRLDKFLHDNADVQEVLSANYIILKINYSPENKNIEFLSQYPKIKGYPHLFVLNKIGKLIHSQDTGDLEKEKSYDLEKVLAFLNKWVP